MPEYLDDPSVLTKDKLKNELLAHNVELPSSNATKDVYVQLYLKNLTAQNKHAPAATLDAFSSDEELPPPVVTSRSRSSGRKATRKTDKVRPDELDVTVLSDQGLRDELLKHGVDAGPIVASTRKLYEKKLQKLLDDSPAQPALPELVLTEIQVHHNGNSESDLYSDKEDEVTPEPEPEPVAEPEPAPVVERPLRSRGKTPVTTRTHSSQNHTNQQMMDEEDEEPVLQVKRRSRRLSSQAMVPEDLRPVQTDQVQFKTNRTVHHRLNSPPRSQPPSTSSRPAQEPEPFIKPLRPAAMSKSRREEHSVRPAAKPSRVEPVTFSPVCNISLTESQGSPWCVLAQFGSQSARGSAAGEEFASTDAMLHKRRQQEITSFLSACSPERTLSCASSPSKDVLMQQMESEVLKELFPNDFNSPTGITATCRRPIKGAADRPVKSSDLWNHESFIFTPKTTKTSSSHSSYTESRLVNRVTSLPSSSSLNSSSRPLSAAPPAAQTKAAGRSMSLWIKLFLLAVVAAFLFLVYQAMETNSNNPFGQTEASDSMA